MSYSKKTLLIKISVLLFLVSHGAAADLIFTAPPREDAQRGMALYQPLADRLSKVIGEKVVYQQPNGWFDYTNKMRKNTYDIVFDGPHFAAWRLKHLNHTALVSLPGKLDFVLIVHKISLVKNIRQLAGKKICGMLSPNLGTDLIFEAFANPVLQPEIFEVKGDMFAVFKAFDNGKCVAAILRSSSYKRLPKLHRDSTKIILKTRSVPNQTFTVSSKLKEKSEAISKFMISEAGVQAAEPLLNRYSKNAKYFVAASDEELKRVENIMEGVIYGW